MSAGDSAGSGTSDVAKQEAANVAQSAGDKAGQLAGTAQEQVRVVATEAKSQVQDLGRELKGQVSEQTNAQRDRLVSTLRSLTEELEQMVSNSGQSGVASEVAEQIADRGRRAADYIQDKQPGDLIEDLQSFARRRSGLFLAGAAAAGLLAGRLTRGAAAAKSDSSSDTYPATQDTFAQYPPVTAYTAPDDAYLGSPGLGTPAATDYQTVPGMQPPAPGADYGTVGVEQAFGTAGAPDYQSTSGYTTEYTTEYPADAPVDYDAEGQRTDSSREGYRS